MNGYLLDTHVLLWTSQRAANEVSHGFFAEVEKWQRNGIAFLSPISAWEIGLLVAAKQVDLGTSVQKLWAMATQDDGLGVVPLSAQILIDSTQLPGNLHRDPTDRILAATARDTGLTLVTRDRLLLDYAKDGHILARKP